MFRVGLTGGVGMGKSTVADSWRASGEEIIDTDMIARELVAPGSEALEEIAAAFGRRMVDGQGALDRPALAKEIFDCEERRKRLEAILHPRIRRRWKETLAAWRAQGKRRAVVVIPLLFETDAAHEFDRTVCVACSSRVQMTRLRQRGWTPEEAKARIAAQWPASRKMELADMVIWNESSLEVCALQAARVLAREGFATDQSALEREAAERKPEN